MSFARSMAHPMARRPAFPITGFGRNPIAALFASGEEGAWYDPSDLSTMFTTSAGSTPASVDGPVGRIEDKSGNANHATQSTAAARPTLRQTAGGLYYLEGDGVDDFLVGSVGASAEQSWIMAVKSDASSGTSDRIMGKTGTASVFDNGTEWRYFRNQAAGQVSLNQQSRASPSALSILTASASSAEGYADGNLEASYDPDDSVTTATDVVMFAESPSATFPLEGRVYGMVLVNRLITSSERTAAESYMAGKSGVTLS